MEISYNFWPLLPEIIVVVVASDLLLLGLFSSGENKDRSQLAYVISLFTLAAAFVATAWNFGAPAQTVFGGMFVDDTLSDTIKLVLYVVVFLVFVYSRSYGKSRGLFKNEYYVLGLFGLAGMMIMASGNHFMSLYLGLELLALCLYAMVAFQRDSSMATEAAMKYFILGAIASGMLLYGMSILYGLTGSLYINDVRSAVAGMDSNNIVLIFALVFVVIGVAFKIGVVPFHMWIPDVYHGSPTSSTAFLGSAPKLAGFALMFRLLVGGLEDLHAAWQDMLIIMALLSIGLGNLIAIAQTNIKRMLAYSTISHMGFFLLGILSGTDDGYGASLFYVIIYAIMSAGAFGAVMMISRAGFEADNLEDFKGLNQRNSWFALLILILMFSMAGIPPAIGFFAKLAVIQAVINAGLVWVAVIAVVFAVVGAFYYLRVVKLMYFDDPTEDTAITPAADIRFLLAVNSLVLIIALPWVSVLIDMCVKAIAQVI